jgi:hypothetical protein
VKERPILFSGPMVRAILEGRKTQTRRVVLHDRKQPPKWATWVNHIQQPTMSLQWVDSGLFQWSDEQTPGKPLKKLRRWPSGQVKVSRNFSPSMEFAIPCPYGKPGDRLWVRESWQHVVKGMEPTKGARILFRADDEAGHIEDNWRPSIFMPRWASRITSEILSVKVERVQDISEADAIAEGVNAVEVVVSSLNGQPARGIIFNPKLKFGALWDSINSKRNGGKFSWAANPWVWVVEFKKLEPLEVESQ